MRRIRTAVGFALFVALMVPGVRPAAAATPYREIESAGPLTGVMIGNELSCQVAYAGDSSLEFYPASTRPGDCGTMLAIDGALFAPKFRDHGGTATGGLGSYTTFTPVTQSAITGSGTAVDPYRIVTVVDAGTTGVRITETDTYITGQQNYRTDVLLTNTGTAARDVIVYRAGDCYLGGSDSGYGFKTLRGSIGCSKTANNSPLVRSEEWIPITAGSSTFQSHYGTVWAKIGSKTSFDNTCLCDSLIDNGAGLSWTVSLAPAGTATFSHLTSFLQGCGEDGVDHLADTPLNGTASKTVHDAAEPVLATTGAGLDATVHELNCSVVVPAEDAVDSVLP